VAFALVATSAGYFSAVAALSVLGLLSLLAYLWQCAARGSAAEQLQRLTPPNAPTPRGVSLARLASSTRF
jgi:hypothetical protein